MIRHFTHLRSGALLARLGGRAGDNAGQSTWLSRGGKWGLAALFAVAFLLFEKLSLLIGVLGVAVISLWRGREERQAEATERPRETTSLPARAATRVETRGAEPEISPREENIEENMNNNVIPLNSAFASAWKDIDDFFQATLDVIKTRFRFKTANIFLLNPEGDMLVQRAYVTRTRSVARLAAIKIGQGLVGWVAAHKRPLVISNLSHEGRSLGYYRAGGEKIVSFAAAPIIVNESVLGVISLDDDQPAAFSSPETEESLLAIAGLLARVLGSEETRERLAVSEDRLRQTRRILKAAYDAPDLDTAAAAALKETGSLVEFMSLALYLLDERREPSRRADIGFHGISGYHCKEPIIIRAVRQALHQCAPFRLEETALLAQYRAQNVPAAGTPQLLYVIPLLHKGEPLGALTVEFTESRTLDERLEGILAEVASGLGGAFLRVYHSATAEGSARADNRLLQLLTRLAEQDSLPAFWQELMRHLQHNTGARGVAVYGAKPDGFALLSATGCEAPAEQPAGGSSLIGWAALAGRPVRVQRNDRRQPPLAEGEVFLACPLEGADGAKRVLLLVADEENALGPDGGEWLTSLAAVLPSVMNRALALEEARQALLRDPLTGLANEAGWEAQAKTWPATGENGFLLLRVDNYDDLLAERGWSEGSAFLRRLGSLLINSAPGGVIARFEGGRFGVLTREPLAEVKERLLRLLISAPAARSRHFAISFSVSTVPLAEGAARDELRAEAESRLADIRARETTVVNAA